MVTKVCSSSRWQPIPHGAGWPHQGVAAHHTKATQYLWIRAPSSCQRLAPLHLWERLSQFAKHESGEMEKQRSTRQCSRTRYQRRNQPSRAKHVRVRRVTPTIYFALQVVYLIWSARRRRALQVQTTQRWAAVVVERPRFRWKLATRLWISPESERYGVT